MGTTTAAMPTGARWLTVEEAGAYMGGLTANAVRMMLRRGRMTYNKVGARVFVDRLSIDRMMEAGRERAS